MNSEQVGVRVPARVSVRATVPQVTLEKVEGLHGHTMTKPRDKKAAPLGEAE